MTHALTPVPLYECDPLVVASSTEEVWMVTVHHQLPPPSLWEL